MNYNDNVELVKEYVDLADCDLKTARIVLAEADPELVRDNLIELSEEVDNMDHKSKHSLLMAVADDNMKDKIRYLKENNIKITTRSIWNAAKNGYEKPEILEETEGVRLAA